MYKIIILNKNFYIIYNTFWQEFIWYYTHNINNNNINNKILYKSNLIVPTPYNM